MERITITIDTGNAVFEDHPVTEVTRILRKLAEDIERDGNVDRSLHDINGNSAGFVSITTETKHTPLHTHHADGGYHPNCKRCQLNAAAPELLEALSGLITHYEWGRLTYDESVYETVAPAIRAARAAIAKVTGKE